MRSNDSSKSVARKHVVLKLERLENRRTPTVFTGQDVAALAQRTDCGTGLVGSLASFAMSDKS